MSHVESSYKVIIDPILVELEGATLHWLMLRLIVPANAQHPQQRTMYDREEIIKTLHTSPIHRTTFLNPAEDLQPGR